MSTRLLLFGDDELTTAVADYATAWGARVGRPAAPSAEALGKALEHDVDVVVVVSREDIQALRHALLVYARARHSASSAPAQALSDGVA
ncbi:hypothetical protein AB0903_29825 [Streptomyces sp. NPDC048389]|uniref:hypothetical protein n=1 Tax=Streptomyces sp. NPDC048389 TaxID=3154622 RepID=UPI0034523E72